VDKGFQAYDFSAATTTIYNFWLYELCDVYLEAIKPVLYSATDADAKRAAQETLYTCMDVGLRLLHPFMPFVTEELFQRMPRRQDDTTTVSIMISPFPEPVPSWSNPTIEEDVATAQKIIEIVRSMRANLRLHPSTRPSLFINVHTPKLHQVAEDHKVTIQVLSASKDVTVLLDGATPAGCAVAIVNDKCEALLMVKDVVDLKAEVAKLEKQKEKNQADLDAVLKRVNASTYAKVPPNVKELDKNKIDTLKQEIELLDKAIANFKSIAN